MWLFHAYTTPSTPVQTKFLAQVLPWIYTMALVSWSTPQQAPLTWSRFIVKAMFIFYRTPEELFCSKDWLWAHCSLLKFSELPYQILERIKIVNLLSDNYLLQADYSFACSDSGFALYNFNLLIISHLWRDLAFFPVNCTIKKLLQDILDPNGDVWSKYVREQLGFNFPS